ncbi:MAG: ABC transporter ATP-binding protein [Synergistaceae bacterium]|jgi:oligopeptide/dipeptide ABC transporter ATP-binding protein|nr:ABC transporter ATP-binding protein [Synergistaceae bacterium]
MALLEIKDLRTVFDTDRGIARAVDGVSFSIEKGETLGVVGESGCGKSVTALSVMRLLQRPAGRVAGGEIVMEGKNLLELSEPEMRKIRGNRISMIFQEPMTSLNPVYTVCSQISEPLMLHQAMSKREARARAIEMLDTVGIPNASSRIDEYPHQFSGGQRQRIMIAMALACNPALLIADEPTTALDVTVQAQILDLMNALKAEFGSSVMLITHSLGVVAETAQRVVVMYAARIVEEAPVRPLFGNPKHPYTRGLLTSIPRMDGDADRLPVIPGIVPSPFSFPSGCRFHDRCAESMGRCADEAPPLFDTGGGHKVRCWLYEKEGERLGSE